MQPPDDWPIVAGAIPGDPAAVEGLVRRYHQPLFHLFLGLGCSWEEAEDLVQEALIKALTHLAGWRRRAAFSTWLYRIALNTWRDSRRRAGYRYETLTGEALGEVPDSALGPAEQVVAAEENSRLRQAISQLPPEQREVVVLRFYQEFSLKEIGEVCNCPVNTVKSRLRLTLQKLQEEMRDEK